MKLLDRYVGKTVLEFVIYSALALIGIELIFTLADQVDDIGEGQYSVWKALQYVLLTAPRKVYEHFPAIALLGGLLGMGRLAAHHELIAMQTAALSVSRILRSVLQVTAIFMVIVILVGEWVAPYSEQFAQKMRASAKHGGFAAEWGEGAWVRHGNWFIYIRDVISSRELRHITAYEMSDSFQLKSIQTIERAELNKKKWNLLGIVASHFEANQVYRTQEESKVIEEWIKPNVLEALVVRPSTMSTRALWRYIHYLEENQLDARKFKLAFWNKIIQPFATGVMLLLAIPFIFGPLRSTSLGWKFVLGGCIAFVFLVSNQLLGHVSLIFRLPPILAATLPTLVFFGIGLILMRRSNKCPT